jgi:hypothetical protein
MPTVLRIGPYRFFFYASDRQQGPHVHVERDDKVAKFWLQPVRLERSGERNTWRFIANGEGIHWTELDEDISVEGLLHGQQSRESHTSLEKWLQSRKRKSPSRRKTPNKTLQPPSRARR